MMKEHVFHVAEKFNCNYTRAPWICGSTRANKLKIELNNHTLGTGWTIVNEDRWCILWSDTGDVDDATVVLNYIKDTEVLFI